MTVAVLLAHRFVRTTDGCVWTVGIPDYAFWQRYLNVFSQVRIVARVQDVQEISEHHRLVNGRGVTVAAVPHYIGPIQYLQQAGRVTRAVKAAVGGYDAVILRVPSQEANCVFPAWSRTGRPYAVEVVGDPYDVFAPGSVRHPLRGLFRWWFVQHLKSQCAHACASAYVTAYTLQRRYPPGPGSYSTHYSSIDLLDEALSSQPRGNNHRGPIRLICVGAMDQMYKAQDVLIDAVARCVHRGMDLRLTLLGDGRHRPALEAQSRRGGLKDKIRFVGRVPPGEKVREQLDAADLFVLPSHQEGLPRAMIEAMARGLPCIGSTAGGIPELLPPRDMVPPGDVESLADKIWEVAMSPWRLREMAPRSYRRALDYRRSALEPKRNALYDYLLERTERWRNKPGHPFSRRAA